jgi:hypothetical protein
MRELHTLISSAVADERQIATTGGSLETFERSVDGPNGLVEFVTRRQTLVREALAGTAPR